jgi:hypothetical protein
LTNKNKSKKYFIYPVYAEQYKELLKMSGKNEKSKEKIQPIPPTINFLLGGLSG